MREYLFSVIIPVYNTEPYLREAFDSIVNQTVGFEDNIQLIIINDGSPDNSEEICLEYKEKYPENIIYIKQENQGVSAARNVGIDTATGKYINFLDSDDLWELDAFEKAGEMLDANDDIDVVGVKVINFENREGDHILNYKFKKDKVVDIHKDFNYIQTQAAPSFIRREALSNIRFNTKLKFLEDAFFMCEVILQKEKYGVLGSSAYMYRRRNSEDSATQTRTTDIKATYIDSLETFHEGLI
ncbi:MAG: glycosyltransferase family 2 protein, partial [Firmicutes bacterium]|nr:glycosyltransferase family 2 protein [Bacillota bacterium]